MKRTESILTRVTNPFENEAPWTPYEQAKAVVVGITLFLVRLATFLLAVASQALVARVASLGNPLKNDRGCWYHGQPLSPWRRLLIKPIRWTNWLFLFSLGFWHIRVDDRRKDKRKLANVLAAAPHMNPADPFIMAAAFPPFLSAVGKADLLELPFMGHTGVAGQGIFVDRKNPDSRLACKYAIAQRADPAWTGLPLLIFPEGTTTNGKVLIQFKTGAFSPGQPVQPVLLQYDCKHFNFSWSGKNGNLGMCLLRMMLQFANFCTVTILDTYDPSQAEINDPVLFANNVRALMAKQLSVPFTEHSYDDVWFAADAIRANVGQDFELGEIKKLYDMDLESLKVLLKRFRQADTDKSGTLSKLEFERALGLSSRSQASLEQFFSFFDTDGSGDLSYREFIQGLALLSGKCSTLSQAKLAFLVFDVEGTGRVKVDVLRKALNKAVAQCEGAEPAGQVLSDLGATELDFQGFCALVERAPSILEAALELSKRRVGITFEAAAAEGAKAKAEKAEKAEKAQNKKQK